MNIDKLVLLVVLASGCASHRAPAAQPPAAQAQGSIDAEVHRLLEAGDLNGAIARVRVASAASPEDLGLHFLLAQLLLRGEQYDEAVDEIRAVQSLDARTVETGEIILGLIASEDGRRRFLGGEAPESSGPAMSTWWSTFTNAPAGLADPATRAAAVLAVRAAWAEVPRRSGTIDGRPFTFLRDADDLLGPGLEVVAGGAYALVPFETLSRIELAPHWSPIDRIWRPVTLTLVDGTVVQAFVPGNYVGSARLGGHFAMGDMTAMMGAPDGLKRGAGQRDLHVEYAGGSVSLIGIHAVSTIVFD